MLNAWGDRATTREASKKLLNSLVDWDVLRSAKTKGHFLLTRKVKTSSAELQLWLLEALLTASISDEIEAQQLLRLPEAFPFSITIGVADLRKSESLLIHRQGLDMDMIGLAKLTTGSDFNPSSKARKLDELGRETSQLSKKKSVASDLHKKPSSPQNAISKPTKRNSSDSAITVLLELASKINTTTEE